MTHAKTLRTELWHQGLIRDLKLPRGSSEGRIERRIKAASNRDNRWHKPKGKRGRKT